ncbi:MAG: aldo/keto reductase, partial [Chloroflexi bacterium]|nr:aldo/keto reductase [Chloroflexota bacterium]
MEYRRLGSSGLEVSAVGLGTNNFGGRMDYAATEKVVRQCMEVGINFIDTSNSYGATKSEEFIGRAVKGSRDKVLLATKVASAMGQGPNQRGTSRKHVLDEVDKSLRRLDTDYIDLYYIHFPDQRTPIEETMRTLDDLVRQGKVRYIGCSNYAAWQVCEAVWTSRMLHLESFVSVQPQWSMLSRGIERELVPFCQEYRIGILPYFPLAGGFLTGKYRQGQPPPEGSRFQKNPRFGERTLTQRNFAALEQIERFAAQRERPMG